MGNWLEHTNYVNVSYTFFNFYMEYKILPVSISAMLTNFNSGHLYVIAQKIECWLLHEVLSKTSLLNSVIQLYWTFFENLRQSSCLRNQTTNTMEKLEKRNLLHHWWTRRPVDVSASEKHFVTRTEAALVKLAVNVAKMDVCQMLNIPYINCRITTYTFNNFFFILNNFF